MYPNNEQNLLVMLRAAGWHLTVLQPSQRGKFAAELTTCRDCGTVDSTRPCGKGLVTHRRRYRQQTDVQHCTRGRQRQ